MKHPRSLADPYRFARFDDPDTDEGLSLVEALVVVAVIALLALAFGLVHTR